MPPTAEAVSSHWLLVVDHDGAVYIIHAENYKQNVLCVMQQIPGSVFWCAKLHNKCTGTQAGRVASHDAVDSGASALTLKKTASDERVDLGILVIVYSTRVEANTRG